jgi:predicted dehydrogenase
MKNIRVGLIGCGYIAQFHARAILDTPNVGLSALAGVELDKAHVFADTYGIPNVFSSAEALIASGSVDALIIATPNIFHARYSIEALNQGITVLVEKPMATNLSEAMEMVQAAKKSSKVLQVGHMWRFDREVRFVENLVGSGKLGRIFKTKSYGVHVNWGPSGWFTQKKLAGGGSLVDMGIHAIDTTRYILGDPLPRRVYAVIGSYVKDFDVDDTATLLIEWDNGVHSIIESGWWHPHMDGPEASNGVYGIKGYASLFPTKVEFPPEAVSEVKIPSFPLRSEHCEQAMYTMQMREFLRATRTGENTGVDSTVGLVAMQIIDAAYTSAQTGRAVKIM